MKTPEQLKGAIRHMAVSQKLSAQQVLQMFLFERILERLAKSPYNQNFILKGGLLISSIIGINARTTLDMDTTVRGIQMEEDEIQRIVQDILSIDVDDGIAFNYRKIQPIREDDAYNNFRIHIDAIYGRVRSPMKIDITTGDEITPEAIRHQYPLMFETGASLSLLTLLKPYWLKNTKPLSDGASPEPEPVTTMTCMYCSTTTDIKSIHSCYSLRYPIQQENANLWKT